MTVVWLSSLYLIPSYFHGGEKTNDHNLDLVLLDVTRWNTTFLLDVDVRKGWGLNEVRGVHRLSCPCVTSDEGGDKVVSLLEAAVSSS